MVGKETHFNCLIIGAGISGIDAAYHLKTYCPWVKYAILERRGNLGGTWDFFKYPGVYLVTNSKIIFTLYIAILYIYQYKM